MCPRTESLCDREGIAGIEANGTALGTISRQNASTEGVGQESASEGVA